jgi:hypothetical protein
MSWAKDLAIPIIIGILTPALTSLGSQLTTGNAIEWLEKTPIIVWVGFAIGIIIWIIIKSILKRKKAINDKGFFKVANPYYDWFNVGEITYNGIVWTLQSTSTVQPEKDAMFAVKPRCPKCRTELDGKQGLLGGEIMRCIGCGYKKRISSYGDESEKAVRLARRDFEKKKGL